MRFRTVALTLLLYTPPVSAGDVPEPALACVACHGPEAPASAPRLDGMRKGYLIKQIRDYLKGTRGPAKADPCSLGPQSAKTLKPAAIDAVATYFSGRPAGPTPAAEPGDARIAAGERLYRTGKLELGVPACEACHGRDGTGIDEENRSRGLITPRLSGQRASYLSGQLQAFRAQERTNDGASMMRRLSSFLTDDEIDALAAYLSTLDPASVPPPDNTPPPRLAKPPKAELCMTCHGQNGESMVDTFPKLAGQVPEYIVKQITDIREGRRLVPVMTPVVFSLTEAEIRAIARWFATFDMRPGPHDAARAKRGERLYYEGNRDKGGYPPCAACHGIDGRGLRATDWAPGGIPRLAGQHPGYLRKAIREFGHARRENDPGEMMRALAWQLSDEEIEDVVQFLYGMGSSTAP